MNQNPKLHLSSKQKEWLSELIKCTSYDLIPILTKSDSNLITTTLFAGFYYEYERVLLNEYLKEYPLQKILRQRK